MLTVVLCGGKGTRLHSITEDKIPKCMVEVAGRPFIDWKLDNLRELGHDDILLLTGHLGEQIEDHVKGYDGVSCLRDRRGFSPLAGADMFGYLPERFWLTYGDTLLDYPRQAIEDRGGWVDLVNSDGVDYGARIIATKRDTGSEWLILEPWHHINTPEDLAETEAWLVSRCASA